MTERNWPVFVPIVLLLAVMFNPVFMENSGEASAWTDGNKDSPVYPNYGIIDMIVDQAYRHFNSSHPDEAKYLYYWYKWDGSDSNDDSFDPRDTIATSDDNFLAWTDDDHMNDGDRANYFIHNRKGWENTDAPSTAQKWANWTMQNLTAWFLQGSPQVSLAKHKAAYCTARMSRYVAKISQYGRTDYSKWDQVRQLPNWDPNEASYQEYYEALLWTDDSMTQLVTDYRSRSLNPPSGLNASRINTHTADIARWVNSRDGTTTTMVDQDSSVITVGKTYKEMLDQFMHCWDNDVRYQNVRGFNETLWSLTLENLIAATENLTAMYDALYQEAREEFLSIAPDLIIVDHGVSPGNIIANDLVTINATVRNDGPMATRNTFLVELSTSSGVVNTRPLTLDPGEEKMVTFNSFKIGSDPVNVTITADSGEAVAESNELDNSVTFMIDPIPEVYKAEMKLADPFFSIRRDTVQPVHLEISNTGNRYDEFELNASTPSEGVRFLLPGEPIGVMPGTSGIGTIHMMTYPDTPIGTILVDIDALSEHSHAHLQLAVQIMERTRDPVPVITGPAWSRSGETVNLSAEESTDPDGDTLTFIWKVPLRGNFTGSRVTFNYTKEGVYDIVLEVNDGNATAVKTLPFQVFPVTPTNLSSYASRRGVSGITVSWKPWRSGGLIAYWIEAIALPGQGALSERGQYISRLGPGNSSGRVGKFLPGTDVEIKLTVDAERFGNRTLDIFRTSTSNITVFEKALHMYVENGYLYIQYKPWLDPEGEREPVIRVERWNGTFVPLPDDVREDIQKTNNFDTIRYNLKANWGRYRSTLTYLWAGESISPFGLVNITENRNRAPLVDLSGVDLNWELNINSTCRPRIQLGLDDPYDNIILDIDWGDGSHEKQEISTDPEKIMLVPLFHNYTAVGTYQVSIRIEDWSGVVVWQNGSLEVHEYRPISLKEQKKNIVVQIILVVLASILLVAVLVALGYVGYKFSKKDTEVEFDLKSMDSDIMKQKPGTGTDFDKRRGLQIPKESIMIRTEEPPSAGETEEAVKPAHLPMIKGSITFDEDEE